MGGWAGSGPCKGPMHDMERTTTAKAEMRDGRALLKEVAAASLRVLTLCHLMLDNLRR